MDRSKRKPGRRELLVRAYTVVADKPLTPQQKLAKARKLARLFPEMNVWRIRGYTPIQARGAVSLEREKKKIKRFLTTLLPTIPFSLGEIGSVAAAYWQIRYLIEERKKRSYSEGEFMIDYAILRANYPGALKSDELDSILMAIVSKYRVRLSRDDREYILGRGSASPEPFSIHDLKLFFQRLKREGTEHQSKEQERGIRWYFNSTYATKVGRPAGPFSQIVFDWVEGLSHPFTAAEKTEARARVRGFEHKSPVEQEEILRGMRENVLANNLVKLLVGHFRGLKSTTSPGSAYPEVYDWLANAVSRHRKYLVRVAVATVRKSMR